MLHIAAAGGDLATVRFSKKTKTDFGKVFNESRTDDALMLG